MFKLDGVAAFVATAEAGSISAAARRLGLAKSVVSERLAELERALGTRLVQRTTRKLSLTEDGHTFLARAQRILFEAGAATAEMAERRGTLVGPLRISAPVGFGLLHLGPALYRFLADHPDIDLALELDDRFVDAAADGFDAVLRHGPVGDNRLVAKRLSTSRRLLVASPGYLARRGVPATLADLAGHDGILYANRDADWRFAGPEGWDVVRPRAVLRVKNGLMMRDAALAGLGITLLPTFFVHDALGAGTLVAVDIRCAAEGAELHIAYPRDRSASAKVLALTASLRASFGDPPYWDR
ncbi:LysR family transcriptional regulator [Sphingomonas sp. RT2P30]|uniref:LysR family transcriptional regulator n=1 Tax=Parasphingomonas halimpatiens TaxID=3096162 RepID=UPI002FCBCE0B